MRELSNSVILQARRYVSGEQVFAHIEKEEAHRALEQLSTTLSVCTSFKETYASYKDTATAECPHNPWRIQHGALFGRLELFIERIASLIDITRTLISFNKLAKVSSEGESRGKAQALEIVIVFPAPLA
ncbi:flagellar outer dynein arm heavy chain beta [Nannochloropsis gaditana CCMP526]|uniref:flagellar outer dynein arm heavy chain beta n=1 Tax=Nannochloropsis gaditana (strain CCMP526) TaxID=1093141 RepID=UPI00029F51E5|nr:flagellar outer dynein arm heavy chain beta [Nannochloropsis gaditana CCMP526]EKU21956.1 flagellar outer dynein arm heavy chain beta [Nannochloropsis gaditana CCMP526]|eukprot:XP_005854405.1 flagellar outer dynein arm heavy chain beta [Nannochloropsis gaditana CCMP526]